MVIRNEGILLHPGARTVHILVIRFTGLGALI
jgi:hypothetical protein